ncbi:MAG: hypothetical protein JWR69_3042 [Pedosphaera sp.]|nr:hypothetical protein [Pedosphaera sp.]
MNEITDGTQEEEYLERNITISFAVVEEVEITVEIRKSLIEEIKPDSKSIGVPLPLMATVRNTVETACLQFRSCFFDQATQYAAQNQCPVITADFSYYHLMNEDPTVAIEFRLSESRVVEPGQLGVTLRAMEVNLVASFAAIATKLGLE